MYYSWVTITGKVYIKDNEVNSADLHEIAYKKIRALFPTDTPVKVTDIEIDPNFRSNNG